MMLHAAASYRADLPCRYVGGFSHGASEELLMQEVYENGPVAISVNTDAVLAATTLMVVCPSEQ